MFVRSARAPTEATEPTTSGWGGVLDAAESQSLRQALVARFGLDVGVEAHAEAVAWAWEHQDRLEGVTNRVGYLYRVAQSHARPHLRWRRRMVLVEPADAAVHPDLDVDLLDALADLRHAQRIAVVLVHCHGWSYAEVAVLLQVEVTAVTNHVHRGLTKLRASLGDDP
jgi:DNA-directed RNA polymerase specialized sigma24 family protein